MASIGQQRQEAIDKWEEDPEGNLQAKEQSDVPYYIRNPEQDPAQGWQQPAEYESTSPFQKSETHRPMGAVVTDDYQTNRVGIKGPEGLEFYSVGDYAPGLGYVEDIDENGRATILPDDPNEPAYKLGHSDSTSQEKADAAEEARIAAVSKELKEAIDSFLMAPSWLEEGETYSAIPDSEEQAEYLETQHKKISHTPDVHHDHMTENIYADALQNIPEDGWDQAVDDMVNRDYEISTPVEDSFEEFQGGQYTEDFVRPDGTIITLMFESGTEYPIANVTGKY